MDTLRTSGLLSPAASVMPAKACLCAVGVVRPRAVAHASGVIEGRRDRSLHCQPDARGRGRCWHEVTPSCPAAQAVADRAPFCKPSTLCQKTGQQWSHRPGWRIREVGRGRKEGATWARAAGSPPLLAPSVRSLRPGAIEGRVSLREAAWDGRSNQGSFSRLVPHTTEADTEGCETHNREATLRLRMKGSEPEKEREW